MHNIFQWQIQFITQKNWALKSLDTHTQFPQATVSLNSLSDCDSSTVGSKSLRVVKYVCSAPPDHFILTRAIVRVLSELNTDNSLKACVIIKHKEEKGNRDKQRC